MPSLGGVTTSMTRMLGYRRLIGATHCHNQRQYEIVKKLMVPLGKGGKPEQFRKKFRMHPETFDWLHDALWECTHAKGSE